MLTTQVYPTMYFVHLHIVKCSDVQLRPAEYKSTSAHCTQVREKRLQEHGVELLWYKVEDLLNPSQERDTRHEVQEAGTEMYLYSSPAVQLS